MRVNASAAQSLLCGEVSARLCLGWLWWWLSSGIAAGVGRVRWSGGVWMQVLWSLAGLSRMSERTALWLRVAHCYQIN